jgi:hypothetical protein
MMMMMMVMVMMPRQVRLANSGVGVDAGGEVIRAHQNQLQPINLFPLVSELDDRNDER